MASSLPSPDARGAAPAGREPEARRRLLLRLWRQLPPRRRRQFFVVTAMTLFGAAAEVLTLGAVLPFLAFIADPGSLAGYPGVERILADMRLDEGHQSLLGLALLFSVAAALAAAVRLWLAWISNRFVFAVAHDLGMRVYDRALHQPYSHHVSHSSSDVLATIAKIDILSQTLLLSLMQAMGALVMGVFIVAALLVVDPLVSSAAMTGFVLIYVSISVASHARLRSHGRVISGVQSHRIRTVQEGLGGIRDILLDGTQPVFLGKFSTLDNDLRLAQARNTFIAAAPRYVIEAAGMVLIVVIAALLSARGGGMAAALPVLGVLALGAQRLLPLAQFVYSAWARLTASRDVTADVLEALEAPGAEDDGAPAEDMPFRQAIDIRNVSLRYPGRERPAVDRLSFTIAKGARIGLVGRSGSGKSTTVDLITGLLEPGSGEILVDGRMLDERTRRSWRRQVAHVPQEIFLADASFLENIAFGVRPEAIDHARVREAAAQAELAEFIESLPKGYAAGVGERGLRLSGGQRKRIGIARALYKRAGVLIFDEATSGLDPETEAAVMAAIAALPRELTVVLVTHRVSTLAFCDRIIRLEAGRIRAAGTYEEVLGRDPAVSAL